jgi:diaminopimelate epimerase
VGGDGVLEPRPTTLADHGVRIWNPDGSTAEKSGNGLRILAWWLSETRAAGAAFTVEVEGAVVGCEVDGLTVDVEMGRARISDPDRTFVVDGRTLRAVTLDVGNPHCVLLGEDDPDTLPWRRWGEVLERDPAFPGRTNVQVARVLPDGAIAVRVWERGAGPTLASGSSACAVAVAAVSRGRLAPGRIPVHMPGGSLEVTVRPDLSVRLRGPVAPVGRFDLSPSWSPS